MQRKEITAETIQRAEWLLGFSLDVSTIAVRLGLTEYVVGVIASDARRSGTSRPVPPKSRRIPNACRSIDAGTIRLVRRMLAADQPNYSEIAREAGISESTVSAIARGERHPGEGIPPRLDEGERHVAEGTRCRQCGALVVVLPCRACRARNFHTSPLQTFR